MTPAVVKSNWGTEPSPAVDTDWRTTGLGWIEPEVIQPPELSVHISHNNFAGYNGISLSHYNAINRVCSEAAREKGYRRIEIRSAIHGTTTYRGPDSRDLSAPWKYYNIIDPFGMHVTVNFESEPFEEEPLETEVLHVYVRRRDSSHT